MQTCTWTGAECPLTGCQETCVADLGVGLARAIVQDRAYGASWFQLCPRLAQIVHLVVDGSPGLTQSPQEAASPSAEISARLSGTAASSTGETSSRLLLAEATVRILHHDVIMYMLSDPLILSIRAKGRPCRKRSTPNCWICCLWYPEVPIHRGKWLLNLGIAPACCRTAGRVPGR